MGLDAVEIVLRTEELFVITIEDDEAAAVRTVGDFYNLITRPPNHRVLELAEPPEKSGFRQVHLSVW